MVNALDPNCKGAYETLLEIVSPELKMKMESGELLPTDIVDIAKSAVLKEHKSGRISAKKIAIESSEKFEMSETQLDLIRKVCSKKSELEATIEPEKKADDESSEFPQLSLPLSAEDSAKVVDLMRRDQELPEYLKTEVKHLDLTGYIAILGAHNFLVEDDREELELTLNKISQTFKNLESLVLPEKANDEWIVLLADKFPNLRCLYITGLHFITLIGYSYIANKLKFIEKLGLIHCYEISDNGVNNILKSLNDPTYLNLKYCKNLSDRGLSCVEQFRSTLQTLDLSGTEVTGEFLKDIDCFSSLERLNLSYCKKLDFNFFKNNDISKFPALQELKLSGVTHLKNDDIKVLLKGCRDLKALHLDKCFELDDEVIKYIATECPNLEFLSIVSCQKVTYNGDVILNFKSLNRFVFCNPEEEELSNYKCFSYGVMAYDIDSEYIKKIRETHSHQNEFCVIS